MPGSLCLAHSGCNSFSDGPRTHSGSSDSGITFHGISARSVQSSRSAQDATVLFTTDETTTDLSLAQVLCGEINETTSSLRIISTTPLKYFTLPECVFLQGTALSTVLLEGYLVVGGNESHRDPLTRFISTARTLNFRLVRFAPYGTSASNTPFDAALPYAPAWADIASKYPLLGSLICSSCGITTLPTILPTRLSVLRLNENLLTGTIPSSMFSNMNASLVSSLDLDFNDNQITGTIPADLFANVPEIPTVPPSPFNITLTSFLFSAKNNRLSGPLPSNMFARLSLNASFILRLSGNPIASTIPEKFLAMRSARTNNFEVAMDNSQLSGAIPSDIFTSIADSSPSRLFLTLNDNLLTGGIHEALLNFSGTCYLQSLTISLNRNSLDENFNDFGQHAACKLMDSLSLYFDNNQLTGGVPRLRMGSTVPLFFTTVSLTFNMLTEPLPSDLLQGQNFSTVTLSLHHNQLTGNVFNFFASLPSLPALSTLTITAHHNAFSGAVPTRAFSNFANTTYIGSIYLNLDFSYNSIEGPLPEGWLAGLASSATLRIMLDFSNNLIGGPFPTNLFDSGESLPKMSVLDVDLTSNAIESLPPVLFPAGTSNLLSIFELNLDSNRISGPLSGSFFSRIPMIAPSIKVTLNHNPTLISEIPASFFELPTGPSALLTFSADNCSLTGTLPRLFNGVPYNLNIALPRNQLHGSFNLSELVVSAGRTTSVTIDLTSNRLNGSFIFDHSSASPFMDINIFASSNNLSHLFINSSSVFLLKRLDVKDNLYLTGELPSTLFNHDVQSFFAANTALSGNMPETPSTGSNALLSLSLANTSIDFCSPPDRNPFLAPNLELCNLIASNIEECRSKYPSACLRTASPPPSAPAPCNPKTRPSLLFACVAGSWTLYSSLTNSTFVIPSGASETVVQGNITSSTIVFGSAGSTLVVSGCLNNLTVVTIELTPSEIEKLKSQSTQLLISYNGSDPSCSDLSSVEVDVKLEGSSCRRVSAQSSISSGQLSALFSVDSSRCNTWWIILVSVPL